MTNDERLRRIQQAIAEGRCFLDTFVGRRTVVSYSHETGWAVTNNHQVYADQRSFLVTTDAFVIEPATPKVPSTGQPERNDPCSAETQ